MVTFVLKSSWIDHRNLIPLQIGKKYDESQTKGLICHWKQQVPSNKLELDTRIKVQRDHGGVGSVTPVVVGGINPNEW